MKHLIAIQEWDKHIAYKHVFVEDDIIIATVTVNVFEDNPVRTFESLWVKPEYRGKGLSHKILEEIIEMPMACMVRKDNVIAINLYKKYGFKFWYNENKEYKWLRNFK